MSNNFEVMQKAEQDQDIFLDLNDSKGRLNGHKPGRLVDQITKEETVKLVQRLFLLQGTVTPRVVVFSGIDIGDGCTSICARAAETLSTMTEGTCCIVDANLRSPGVHEYLQLRNRSGLSEALARGGPLRDFAQQVRGGKLWVLTAGTINSDPSALLSSGVLPARLAELRAAFAYILIDTPPANLFGDAASLGKQSDGAVLVLSSNTTRREAARKTKRLFEESGIPVLGAVLNRRTFPIPQALYEKL